MDEDGSLHVEGRQIGNPEHAVGEKGRGSGISAD
jgi:hypothetical protein